MEAEAVNAIVAVAKTWDQKQNHPDKKPRTATTNLKAAPKPEGARNKVWKSGKRKRATCLKQQITDRMYRKKQS